MMTRTRPTPDELMALSQPCVLCEAKPKNWCVSHLTGARVSRIHLTRIRHAKARHKLWLDDMEYLKEETAWTP